MKYPDYHIDVFYSEEDECYVANIPDLKYCSAFGDTPEEAMQEVLIAKEMWLESTIESGLPLPPLKYRPISQENRGKSRQYVDFASTAIAPDIEKIHSAFKTLDKGGNHYFRWALYIWLFSIAIIQIGAFAFFLIDREYSNFRLMGSRVFILALIPVVISFIGLWVHHNFIDRS